MMEFGHNQRHNRLGEDRVKPEVAMMTLPKRLTILAVLVVVGGFFAGCGGGGGTTSPPPSPQPTKKTIVSWEVPQSFADNTLFVPSRDLQGYEIYVRQDLPFQEDDNPVATATSLESSFDLATLAPPLSQGVTYHLSIRLVTAYDTKSEFSPAVSFSIP
jgi:hypothetical protein